MIVEIEKPRRGSGASLAYNEAKVLRGVAELAAYANLPSTDWEDVQETFARRERSVRYPTLERSFHASVNPSPEDRCGEEDVLRFVKALMDHLGYGGQPYLVYRHFDIDREHWHVVSTRIGPDGRKIPNYYEKRRASAFIAENARRFRYCVPLKGSRVEISSDLAAGEASWKGIPCFDPRKGVVPQVNALARTALGYSFSSLRQLISVLADMGLEATPSADGLVIRGLDRKGERATGPLTPAMLGSDWAARAREAVRDRGARRPGEARSRERVRRLVGFAFGVSRSEGHFRNILRLKGIGVHLSRTEEGRVFGITLVDHVGRTVVKASELGGVLTPRMVEEAISSGRWRKEGAREPRNAYVKESRRDARAAAVTLRDIQAGALARDLMAPLPQGPSGTGVPPRDDDDRRKEGADPVTGFRESFTERVR